MTRINSWACFFLVALRLAIGWHFAVEGWHKIRSHQIGKTSTNTPWTSEPFFREAYGPIADWYRQMLGLDEELHRFDLTSDASLKLAERSETWDEFANRLIDYYGLSENQKSAVRAQLATIKADDAAWLQGQVASPVEKPVAWGKVDIQQTVPERVAEYTAKRKEIREAQEQRNSQFNADVEKGRLRALKAEAGRLVAALEADLAARTMAGKRSLLEAAALTPEQQAKGELPEPTTPVQPIDRLDTITMWLQFILGGCLLVGLFSRLSSLLLAGFLMQVILLMPATPTAPIRPGMFGHYLYVDLFVIELIALLALAVIPTGRWFGLDALFSKRGSRCPVK